MKRHAGCVLCGGPGPLTDYTFLCRRKCAPVHVESYGDAGMYSEDYDTLLTPDESDELHGMKEIE